MTIILTSGNDAFNGTAAGETIFGLDGNDTINGLGGNDNILGDIPGSGNDILIGAGGNDTIFGSFGNDTIGEGQGAEAGDDFLIADVGDDLVTGGLGDDVVFGGFGNDTLTGDDGNDFLFGEAGTDNMDGGAGNDRMHVDSQDSFVSGGAGIFDVLVPLEGFGGTLVINLGAAGNQNGGAVGPQLQGFESVDASLLTIAVNLTGAALNGFGNVLIGGSADDTITGSTLADIILAGTGDDTIRGGNGDDSIIGDVGADTFVVATNETGTTGLDDFTRGTDLIQVVDSNGNTDINAINAAIASQTVVGGDTQLTIGTKIVVVPGTTPLTADDFATGDFTLVPSQTGTEGDDTITVAVNTNGGTSPLVGEPGGSVIDGGNGSDALRLTGDADARIDLTDGQRQLEQLDLNGDGVISGAGETNVDPQISVRNFEVVDAYPRQTLLDPNNPSAAQLGSNYFGDLRVDGTSSGENIILGGFGDDTILTGTGTDFVAGGSGEDSISTGRDADFIFVEVSLLDPTDDPAVIEAGDTVSLGGRDNDWFLGEASNDDEPLFVFVPSNVSGGPPGGLPLAANVFTEIAAYVSMDGIENVDLSGNLYVSALSDLNVELGGARDFDGADADSDPTNDPEHRGVGIGSTAQARIFDATVFVFDPDDSIFDGDVVVIQGEEDNIFVGGYDFDEIIGFGGGDRLYGGNGVGDAGDLLAFGAAINPALAGITNDGADEVWGGTGDDTVGYESYDNWEDGDGYAGADAATVVRGGAPQAISNVRSEVDAFDTVDGGGSDWLQIDSRTTHESMIEDALNDGLRRASYGLDPATAPTNQVYDRGLIAATTAGNADDVFNIDGPGDGADSGTVADEREYLFIDLDAVTYASLVTGVTSQDQTGGVGMQGFENVDGGGFGDDLAAYLADLDTNRVNLSAAFDRTLLDATTDIETDNGASDDSADNLIFNATSVRLDLRGTDAELCTLFTGFGAVATAFQFDVSTTINFDGIDVFFSEGQIVTSNDDLFDLLTGPNAPAQLEAVGDFFFSGGSEGVLVEAIDNDDPLGQNTLIGGTGTDRIEGRIGNDVLFGGPDGDAGPVADLFAFDAAGAGESSEGSDGVNGNDTVDLDDRITVFQNRGNFTPFEDGAGFRRAPGGDGVDVIGDFAGGQGVGRTENPNGDQVLFAEYNDGRQGYFEDRAAELYDPIQLDAGSSPGNNEGAVQAADMAVFLGSNSVIATKQFYSADIDDIQQNDVVTLTINGRTFTYTAQQGENQLEAARALVCQINQLAGQDTELFGLTAYLDNVGYGEGAFEDDWVFGADELDPDDVGGDAIRISFANLDPNILYSFTLSVNGNDRSSGDQFNDGRLNNDSGTYIFFADYNGANNGFDAENVLFMLRNSPQGSSGAGTGVQTSVLGTALTVGGVLTGLDALAPDSSGVHTDAARGTFDVGSSSEASAVFGAYGDDQLFGGAGNDTLAGGTNTTGSANNTNTGDDVFHGSLGNDAIHGGGNLSSSLGTAFYTDRLLYSHIDPNGVGNIEVNITSMAVDITSSFGSSPLRGVDGNVVKQVDFSDNPNGYQILGDVENTNNYGLARLTAGSTTFVEPEATALPRDVFTGMEVVDKYGGAQDKLDVQGLSGGSSGQSQVGTGSQDLALIRINLTTGNVDVFNDTDAGTPDIGTFIGRFRASGFEWVYGGSADEEVIMQAAAVDINGDGNFSNDAFNVLVPNAFESNLINLGTRTDDGDENTDDGVTDGDGAIAPGDGGGDPDEADTVTYSFYGLDADYDCDGEGDNRPDVEVFVSAIGEGVLDDDVLDPRTGQLDQVDVVRMSDGLIDPNGGLGPDPAANLSPAGDVGGLSYVDDHLVHVEIIDFRELDDNNLGPNQGNLQVSDDSTSASLSAGVVSGDFENPLFDILNVTAQSNRALQGGQSGIFDGIVANYSQTDVTISGTLALPDPLDPIDGDFTLEGANEYNAIARGNRPGEQLLIIRGIDEFEVFFGGSGNDRIVAADVDEDERANTTELTPDFDLVDTIGGPGGLDLDPDSNTLQLKGQAGTLANPNSSDDVDDVISSHGTGNATGSMVETQDLDRNGQEIDSTEHVSFMTHGDPDLYFRYFMDGGNNDIIDYRNVDRTGDFTTDLVVMVDFDSTTNIVLQTSEGRDGDRAIDNTGVPEDGVIREGARDKILFDNDGDRQFDDSERVDFAYDNEIYLPAVVDGTVYGNNNIFGPADGGAGDTITVSTKTVVNFDNSNVIDVREFGVNATESDAIGANSTADDVFIVMGDGTRLDPNNGDVELQSHNVRTGNPTSGFLIASFVDDADYIENGDGTATVTANPSPTQYWNEIQGGEEDDIVFLDDEQIASSSGANLFHSIFLGRGSNVGNYNAVADGATLDYVFYNSGNTAADDDQTTSPNSSSSTQSDIAVLLDLGTAYTDEVHVIEQDNITGNGLQRELTIDASTDSGMVDVLNLNSTVLTPSDPFNSETSLITLQALFSYALGANASGVVIQGVAASEQGDAGGPGSGTGLVYDVTDGTLTSGAFNPSLYDVDSGTGTEVAAGDDLSLASIMNQSIPGGDTVQLGNTKLGLRQFEVVDGSDVFNESLIMMGYVSDNETLYGGDGNDRIYFTGDTGDLLDAFAGGRVLDVFTGGFGDNVSATDTTTDPSDDFDTLAVIDSSVANSLSSGTYTFDFSVAGNQFTGGPSGVNGAVFDFENFDGREVAQNTDEATDTDDVFFVVTAMNPGVTGPSVTGPDGDGVQGSILFGGNQLGSDADGTSPGDGGDTLQGGLGDDTMGGAFGGDLISLADTDTGASDGEDVVVYQAVSDSPFGLTDDHQDLVTGFLATSGTATGVDTDEDVFDFAQIDANVNIAGNQAFTFIGVFDNRSDLESSVIFNNFSGTAVIGYADFVDDATVNDTAGALFVYDGSSFGAGPQMIINVTGTGLSTLAADNFIG